MSFYELNLHYETNFLFSLQKKSLFSRRSETATVKAMKIFLRIRYDRDVINC